MERRRGASMPGSAGRAGSSAGDTRRLNLAFGLAIALPILLGIGWILWSERVLQTSVDRIDAAQESLSESRLYDEVLTMSARMAAETGDPSWASRYRQAESALGGSLARAASAAVGSQVGAVLAANGANDGLVALEHQALDDVAVGDLAAARDVLGSDRYRRLKEDYASGLGVATAAFEDDLQGQLGRWRALLVAQLVVTVVVLSIVALLARMVVLRSRREERRAREEMDSAVIGMALETPDSTIAYVNPALCTMLGREAEQLVGRAFVEFTHPDDVEQSLLDREHLAAGSVDAVSRRKRLLRPDGEAVWVDVVVAAVRGRDGRTERLVKQVVNVTTEVTTLEALHRETERFRLLAENATDVVYRTDADGRIAWISESVRAVLGYEPEELVGRPAIELIDPRDVARVDSLRAPVYEGGREFVVVARYLAAGGVPRTMQLTVRRIAAGDDTPEGAAIGLRDITDEELIRSELERSERLFRLAIEGAPSGVALAAPDGTILEANPALCALLDADRGAIVGRTLATYVAAEDCGTEADMVEHQHRLLGTRRESWVKHSIRLVRDSDGTPRLLIHQFVDETEAHALQQEVAYRASHDVLTGLSNRDNLMRALEGLTSDRRDSAAGVGVLFCDVDNLKPINDNHGHQVGDLVLTAVAERMARIVRASDLVARIGGDEFVVVLRGVADLDEVTRIADKIRAGVSSPVTSDSVTVGVTVSVGATMARPHESPKEILGRADEALYESKTRGRDRTSVRG
jgi:diguanylate cyclase (GGDEF)-like protein/PAS domain S-box-containing protein